MNKSEKETEDEFWSRQANKAESVLEKFVWPKPWRAEYYPTGGGAGSSSSGTLALSMVVKNTCIDCGGCTGGKGINPVCFADEGEYYCQTCWPKFQAAHPKRKIHHNKDEYGVEEDFECDLCYEPFEEGDEYVFDRQLAYYSSGRVCMTCHREEREEEVEAKGQCTACQTHVTDGGKVHKEKKFLCGGCFSTEEATREEMQTYKVSWLSSAVRASSVSGYS